MIKWNKIKKNEYHKISEIINRTMKSVKIKDRMSAEMDIMAAHLVCRMNLDKLLSADDFNFFHDVFGIMENINRKTGKIDNCFMPRCAR